MDEQIYQNGVFVYVIEAVAVFPLVKIGIASNPNRRLAQLRTSSPFKLSLARIISTPSRLAASEVERATFSVLSLQRMKGEWFSVPVAIAIDAVEKATFEAMDRAFLNA